MLKQLINNGITADVSFSDQKKIRVVNGMCLFALTVSIIFFIIWASGIGGIPFFPQLVLMIVFGTIYFLNHRKLFFGARALLCVFFPSFLVFPALTIPNMGSAAAFSLLSISLLPVFLFDKKIHVLIFFLFNAAVLTVVIILQRLEIVMPMGNPRLMNPVFFFELAISLMGIYIFTMMFKSDHERYESTISEKNKELEIKNEDIVSSISYARRIQNAVLPSEESISRSIPLSSILYKPRDIVSGDFFWFHELNKNNYILAAGDCTGHGVPGAFMTVIGTSLLNQIIIENKITQPSEILHELDKRITTTLKQEKERSQNVRDGMDLSLIKVDKERKEFVFTSAKRPAIFIRNQQIREFKGSKDTLGGLRTGEKNFEEIKISYLEDDTLYLFTDGYIDQFGGINNKKFMIKRFRELLLEIHLLPMSEQRQKLEANINYWIGNNEQTDDITVMGIRF
jgi:serine phosphatase RsbU (regulator of sigma subunit)